MINFAVRALASAVLFLPLGSFAQGNFSCPEGFTQEDITIPAFGEAASFNLEFSGNYEVSCSLSGGTGEADLFMVFEDEIFCGRGQSGNEENCVRFAVGEGAWTIEVDAPFGPISGVQLSCACAPIDENKEKSCPFGFVEDNIALANGESAVFLMDVIAGDTVTCETSGGDGTGDDVDLYMMIGYEQYCMDSGLGVIGDCSVENDPTINGTFVTIDVKADSPDISGVQLNCTCSPDRTVSPTGSPTVSPTVSPTTSPTTSPTIPIPPDDSSDSCESICP